MHNISLIHYHNLTLMYFSFFDKGHCAVR